MRVEGEPTDPDVYNIILDDGRRAVFWIDCCGGWNVMLGRWPQCESRIVSLEGGGGYLGAQAAALELLGINQ